MPRLSRRDFERATGSIEGEHATDLPHNPAPQSYEVGDKVPRALRIALLTPYTGGNLGDAAIQDAIIANIRLRIPGVQFSGVTLNSHNFLERHGTAAFPLVGAGIPFFQMDHNSAAMPVETNREGVLYRLSRRLLRRAPAARVLKQYFKKMNSGLQAARLEINHWVGGYRFLRAHDLLLFSGGGQLDDNYGGPWGLPFSLCKWAALSRLARVPCAMASVGVGIINSPISRELIAVALRLCCYRSFREPRSKTAAASLFHGAANDPVVPDMALSLSDLELPASAGTVRTMAARRPIIALSPMAFAKPVNWPAPDSALHDRYVREMAKVLTSLCARGYFIVIACSSRGDDESVIPDIVEHLDSETRESLQGQVYFPRVQTWRELISVLRNSDYLIASRLHGSIFGFITQTPVIAISFASKVDWVIEYLKQNEYRLDIRDFKAEDVLRVLDRIKEHRDAVVESIKICRREILSNSASTQQYDMLAGLALNRRQS